MIHSWASEGTLLSRARTSAQPIFETLPGWAQEIQDVTDRGDLPVEAQRYLDRIEEILELPIDLVSVGPERTQTMEAAGCRG